ncbi:unnamed protein product, partial [Urochloa humidicola]
PLSHFLSLARSLAPDGGIGEAAAPAVELACAGGGGAWPAAAELAPWRGAAAAASFLGGNGRRRGSL